MSTLPFDALKAGEVFYRGDVAVTVLEPAEATEDRFGRAMSRLWCRREDTGVCGWVVYGPGGVVTVDHFGGTQ